MRMNFEFRDANRSNRAAAAAGFVRLANMFRLVHFGAVGMIVNYYIVVLFT